MSRCPDAGALRAALDGERPDVAAHLSACPACRAGSREQDEDASVAAQAFAVPPPAVGIDAALERVRSRGPAEVIPLAARAQVRPPTTFGRAAAALVLLVVFGLLATPSGRAGAAALLERFRAERVAVIPVDLAAVDPAALEALADVAEIERLDSLAEPQPVTDLDEAAAIAGFEAAPLDTSALPPSIDGPVVVLAQAPQTVRVDFADDADLPTVLHEAVLVLHLPGAILQTVGGVDGKPAAVRGEAGTLEVEVEGGTLVEVRDALLSLPGLPAETVAALRAIEDWETTLPLPVPAGQLTWEETTVAGRSALAFGDESGLGSALLWREDGRFVGVGGMLPLSEVRRLAEGA
jgi:hypothetical protein